MERRTSNWLVAAALFAGGPALGQAAGEDAAHDRQVEESQIVVTAQPEASPEEFERAVESFVKDLGEPGPINRISRWGEPVCPKVAGLSEPFNAFVGSRIKDVATQVGAPAGAECGDRANVLVLFTSKPHDLAADIRRNHKALLGYHFVGQRKSVAAFEPPMKSWYVTMSIIPGSYAAIDAAYGPKPPGKGNSRIRPPYQSRFAFALIVVDANLMEGQEIGPVADKVAMLALSNPGPREGCSQLPSVLDLLEPDCGSGDASDGLTEYDQTYLQALYAFDRDELKGLMREEIADRIMAELGPLTENASAP